MNVDAQQSDTKKYLMLFRFVVLVAVAVLIMWIGVSWRYGWSPFALQSTTQQEIQQNDTTATGPSALSPEQQAALIKNTTATKSTTLSPEEERVLIDATSAR